MQLSVVIVSYNVKHLLEQCLLSLEKASAGIQIEIFVVDNASTDDSEDYFKGRFNAVRFSWNKSNVGFSKANNIVLNEVSGEHILFLNPDTVLPEGCLKKCLDFFSTHSDCGALGVRMLDGNGIYLKESKRGFPGIATSFYKMTGLHKWFPRSETFARYYLGHLPENETNAVDILSGAFMMLSKEALAAVKGFDEDFFMYAEDIDLSCRITKAGFKNYYFPEVSITHFKGKSTRKKSAAYTKHFYGSMKIFVKKYYKDNWLKQRLMFAAIDLRKLIADIGRMI